MVQYNLILNDNNYLFELEDFAIKNEIVVSILGKNYFVVENSTEEKMRKILYFINDDLVYMSEFAFIELKNNIKDSFTNGMNLKEFCEKNKIFIEVSFYFKKIHVYGTPWNRKKVKDLINNYLDELNSSILNKQILIPENVTLKNIYNFVYEIKKYLLTKQVFF